MHRGTKLAVSKKLGDRSDDPDWVRNSSRLRVDRLYYAQQMVQPAVERMCTFLADGAKKKIKETFKEARRKIRLQLDNQLDIKSFFLIK